MNTGTERLGESSESGEYPALGNLAQQLCNGWGRNDLQPPAEAASGEVSQALQWLQTRYGNSRMTGSGSAVFARISDSADRESEYNSGSQQEADIASDSERNLKATLAGLPDGWVGRICRSLDVHPLRGWAVD
ncbi:hypothetical protein [Roseateles amylovorans]|uniref:hypothetical protein n=1 Tax=Roseateles amylovorans TaxID=2978473 RepID=UPI003F494B94